MVYEPRTDWEGQCLPSQDLGKVLLTAHLGSFSMSTPLYFYKRPQIFGNTQVESLHTTSSSLMSVGGETHPCQLNREKMEDLSVYFDKCKWILFLVKMLSRPQWNELCFFFFFFFSGWREWRGSEMNAQDRLLWFEMKTNNFREKKRLSLFWRPWHSCRYIHELIIKILKCGINHVVFNASPQ